MRVPGEWLARTLRDVERRFAALEGGQVLYPLTNPADIDSGGGDDEDDDGRDHSPWALAPVWGLNEATYLRMPANYAT